MAVPSGMKRLDVLVVGEIYVDHILSGFEAWPGPGEEVLAKAYEREIGGGAANTACGLARLGKSVGLMAIAGRCEEQWLRARLDAFGVSTSFLMALDGPTGVTVSVSTREDRSFFTHLGANAGLDALLSDADATSHLTAARHVHFAMPLSATLAGQILPVLTAAGCTTSLDVGYQPQWLADRANFATLGMIDHFLPNELEASLLTGGAAGDVFSLARAHGLNIGALKLGSRGGQAMGQDGPIAVAPPRVQAIDTTGAGDAFDAGFIDALLDGADRREMLQRACICGGLSTRAAGALAGLCDRNELWSVYDQTYRS